jgi:VWFA-related protein
MRGVPKPRTVVCASLCVAAVGVWASAQSTFREAQLPQFKSGIDIMRVEVTVVDRHTRQPIRGLTIGDFVVKVNGQPQEVVALTEIVAPGADTSSAEWTLEAPIDVADNRRHPASESERLIAIVMDDAIGRSTGVAPYNTHIGKAAAHRIVDELGPHDRAAVIFAQFNQHAQEFTSDRTLLRRAIETYSPQTLDPILAKEMSLATLLRTRAFMAGMPEHRRAVFYITLGIASSEEDGPQDLQVDMATSLGRESMLGREGAAAHLSLVQGAVQAARLAHVPVYPISTEGLVAPGPNEIRRGLGPMVQYDVLRALADSSGGRAVYNTNAPDREIARIFDELSSTYMLAYSASFPMDGKVRQLQVQVTRRDAEVTLGTLHFRTPRATAEGGLAPSAPRAATLVEAIASPIAGGVLPLQLAVAPFALAEGTRDAAAVVMTLGVSLDEPVAQGQVELLDLETRIFDAEGRKQFVEHRQTARLGARADLSRRSAESAKADLSRRSAESAKADPGTPYEIALRHDLRPGRYHVRIGALLADGRSGSVHATFTVPHFSRDALSLSGVAIGRAGAAPAGAREVLDGLLTFAPTLARVFSRDDVVGALVRVHQPPGRVSSVDVETRITNAAGEVAHSRTTDYTPSAFAAFGHVEHRFELPLKALEPGDYLLTFAATTGRATATRDVRFGVRR